MPCLHIQWLTSLNQNPCAIDNSLKHREVKSPPKDLTVLVLDLQVAAFFQFVIQFS